MTNDSADNRGYAKFGDLSPVQSDFGLKVGNDTFEAGNAQGNGLHGLSRAQREAARTAPLADLTFAEALSEVERLRRLVTDLSQPRIFNAVGLVDADLAARYESLRASFDAVTAGRDEYRTACELRDRRISEHALRIADLETERDALRVSCARKDHRIDQYRSARISDSAMINAQIDRISRIETERDTALEAVAAASALAKRYRDERGTYTDDDLTNAQETLRRDLVTLGSADLHKPEGERRRIAMVEGAFRGLGLRNVREQRPRVTVVTSPRFYSDEQRERAVEEVAIMVDLNHGGVDRKSWPAMIDLIAAALGMRRAAK